jgi:hypothetical protein
MVRPLPRASGVGAGDVGVAAGNVGIGDQDCEASVGRFPVASLPLAAWWTQALLPRTTRDVASASAEYRQCWRFPTPTVITTKTNLPLQRPPLSQPMKSECTGSWVANDGLAHAMESVPEGLSSAKDSKEQIDEGVGLNAVLG